MEYDYDPEAGKGSATYSGAPMSTPASSAGPTSWHSDYNHYPQYASAPAQMNPPATVPHYAPPPPMVPQQQYYYQAEPPSQTHVSAGMPQSYTVTGVTYQYSPSPATQPTYGAAPGQQPYSMSNASVQPANMASPNMYPTVSTTAVGYTATSAESYGVGGAAPIANPVDPIKPKATPPTGWRDWPFAILLGVNILAICAVAIAYGSQALSYTADVRVDGLYLFYTALLGVLAFCSAYAVCLMMVKNAKKLINFSMWFSIGVTLAFAALCWVMGGFFLAIVLIIFAGLFFCYKQSIKNHIKFAALQMKAASLAVVANKSLYAVAIIFTVVQMIWFIVWAVAMVGIYDHYQRDLTCNTSDGRDCQVHLGGVMTFFMILSLSFGLLTFRNIVHTTVCGTVASWWYNMKDGTWGAVHRTCTTSLGSVALGSLILAFVEAVQQMLKQQRQEGNALACIGECLVGCIKDILEYLTRWAFTYVGVYGFTFVQSGKEVMNLFKARGWTAIINDSIVRNVLRICTFIIGLCCGALGFLLGVIFPSFTTGEAWESGLVLCILGFIIGAAAAGVTFSVIDSAVATIFVCLAEDPAALRQKDPTLYRKFIKAWAKIYPDDMASCNYGV